jgi:hypothetical protein
VKDRYNENYKSPKKKSMKTLVDGRICLWFNQINIVKMAIILKEIYMFNTIHIKIPMKFFRDTKVSPKVCIEAEKMLNSQSIPEQKKQF